MSPPRSYRDGRNRLVRIVAAVLVVGLAGPLVVGAFQALGLDPRLAFLLVLVAVASYVVYARRQPRDRP